jgi:hypothetical protein
MKLLWCGKHVILAHDNRGSNERREDLRITYLMAFQLLEGRCQPS